MHISIIVAFDKNQLIGNNNQLPWHLPADLKHFKMITMGHTMIMGRKTFESIGKPLPGRTSVIVTRQRNFTAESCYVVHSMNEAIGLCQEKDEVFIIGGAQIFNEAISFADRIYTTLIHHEFSGDTHFPPIDPKDWDKIEQTDYKADEKNPWDYSFINYERKHG